MIYHNAIWLKSYEILMRLSELRSETLIKRKKKINLFRIYWFFIWTNWNPLHPRMLCAMFGWNWPSGSREEDCNFLPLEKDSTLYLNKLESTSSKNALCQFWLNLANWFWWRRFLNFVHVFRYFVIISPWRRTRLFIWTNLNPLHQRILCANFGWNWLSGSGEDFF